VLGVPGGRRERGLADDIAPRFARFRVPLRGAENPRDASAIRPSLIAAASKNDNENRQAPASALSVEQNADRGPKHDVTSRLTANPAKASTLWVARPDKSARRHRKGIINYRRSR